MSLASRRVLTLLYTSFYVFYVLLLGFKLILRLLFKQRLERQGSASLFPRSGLSPGAQRTQRRIAPASAAEAAWAATGSLRGVLSVGPWSFT